MARDGPPPEEPYDSAERSVEERRRLVKEAMDRFFAPDQVVGDTARPRTADRTPAAGRDLVSTSRGVRPQRSTEEHGSGLDREVPERPGRDAWSEREQAAPPSAGPGTPEGHAAERPAAAEYGELGTPAAAFSPATPHAADAEAGAHAPDAHAVAANGHAEEHEEETLGPIDWRAWGAAALGVAAAALIAILFYVASLPR